MLRQIPVINLTKPGDTGDSREFCHNLNSVKSLFFISL